MKHRDTSCRAAGCTPLVMKVFSLSHIGLNEGYWFPCAVPVY